VAYLGEVQSAMAVQKSACGKSHQIGTEKRACGDWSGAHFVGFLMEFGVNP
jgi:hypothetical protein